MHRLKAMDESVFCKHAIEVRQKEILCRNVLQMYLRTKCACQMWHSVLKHGCNLYNTF